MNTAQKFTDTDSEDEKSEHDASRAATPIPEFLEVAGVTEGALEALEQAADEIAKDEVCMYASSYIGHIRYNIIYRIYK